MQALGDVRPSYIASLARSRLALAAENNSARA